MKEFYHVFQANCMAIHSVLEHYKKWIASAVNNNFETKKPHIITTLMEHDAIRLHLTRKFHREIGNVSTSYLVILLTVNLGVMC